jgi:hypothetical protein
MDDLLERLREQVERSTSAIDVQEIVGRDDQRRRSRRANLVAVGALLVLVVGVAALALRAPTTTEPSAAPAPALVEVSAVEVHTGADDSQQVTFIFDGPLPDPQVALVEDITALRDPTQLGYAIQGSSALHVCQYTHFFGEHPGGSVDLLIPAGWLVPDPEVDQPRLTYEPSDRVNKIPACGPYYGYVQYSIWGAPSDEPGNVSVSVDPTRTRVTVEMQPEG